MGKFIWIIGGIIFLALGWYLLSPLFIVKTANDELPPVKQPVAKSGSSIAPVVNPTSPLLTGQLIPSAHSVIGNVKVIELIDQKILRFENLDTINGPDLYIYLATDTTANDFINLGEIKATKGNVNYDIPAGTDLEKYNTVLIWCKQFHVLFSYAKLS